MVGQRDSLIIQVLILHAYDLLPLEIIDQFLGQQAIRLFCRGSTLEPVLHAGDAGGEWDDDEENVQR